MRAPFAVGLLSVAPLAVPLAAQTPAPSPSPEPMHIVETVVVSASRSPSALVDAPATLSVIDRERIELQPETGYAELLRSVPGLNLIQTSARDFNVTTRQSAKTTTNTQLVLLDGRMINIDYLGVVGWEFVPANAADVQQIEVVRGPASVVWGANAMTGVVNILTRDPRDAPGTHLALRGGVFGRDVGLDAGRGSGTRFGVSASHSRVLSERWALRASGEYYESDALPRPAGRIPAGTHPLNPAFAVGGGVYPPFANQGTRQPKLDLRLDQELSPGSRLTYAGGFTGTGGLAHTPIGPFDISDWDFSYGRVAYRRGNFHLAGFANLLRGSGPNLLTRDATGRPVELEFRTNTFDLEAGDSQAVGAHQLLTYGGNLRRNNFDYISTSPGVEDRNELGAYLQDEIFAGRFRLALGARVDKFTPIADPIFSPRVALIFKPAPTHALRASWSRAFRAPAATENYFDISTITGFLPLGRIDPRLAGQEFPIVTRSIGKVDLRQESLSSWELAYDGTWGRRTTVGVALYLSDNDDIIRLVTDPRRVPYTSAQPPPGWPLPPFVLDLLAQQGIFLPAQFQFLNLGPVRNRGVELSLAHRFEGGLRAYANYSWQDRPEPRPAAQPFPPELLDLSPEHRLNAGLELERGRALGSLAVSHVSRAFWADVLGPDLWGWSPAYTRVDASAGLRFADGRVTALVKVTNLLDQDIQQHVFGDILKRSVSAELRLDF